MLLLTTTSDKLQVVSGSAVTVDVHATYVDHNAGTITPGRTNTAITTATTTDVVGAPGASTQRNVQTLTIRNKHASSSNAITVQHTDGTTVVELVKYTLLAGETLEFLDGVGWRVLDATGTLKTSGPAQSMVDIFTTPGSNTWTKRPGAKSVDVLLIGAGGGGGSGRKGAAASVRCGGGGGAPGGIAAYHFSADILGATETVTIGTGGTGGAAQATNSTNGNNGVAGTDTSFGSWLAAAGGDFGDGGSNAAGAGGGLTTGWPDTFGLYNLVLAGGFVTGASASATGGVGATGGMGSFAPAGGGAGGAVGKITAISGYNAALTGGTAGTVGGGQNGGAGNSAPNDAGVGGSGGGGGAASTTGNAGTGGTGGDFGAGGGGGGAAVDATGNSGAGGNGANGRAMVITHF